MSTHTITAVVPVGDSDIGAEVEIHITYNFIKGAPEQGPTYLYGGLPPVSDEIEFLKCVGPLQGDAFDDLRQQEYDELARAYLETDDGVALAAECASDEHYKTREDGGAIVAVRRKDSHG